jgi:hypothetical protein
MEGGNRRQSLQQGAKLPEDFLGTICRTLKLSPVQTIAVAYAISRSQYRSLAQDAVKLLRSRLPEIGASSPLGELSEDILHGLALLASSSEVGDAMTYFDSLPSCSFSVSPSILSY